MLQDLMDFLCNPDNWDLSLDPVSRLKRNRYKCVILDFSFCGKKELVALDDKDNPINYEKACRILKLKDIHTFVKKEHLYVTVQFKQGIPEIDAFDIDVVQVLYDFFNKPST